MFNFFALFFGMYIVSLVISSFMVGSFDTATHFIVSAIVAAVCHLSGRLDKIEKVLLPNVKMTIRKIEAEDEK